MTEIFPIRGDGYTNPADLALAFVEQISVNADLVVTPQEEKALVTLDSIASDANMHANYLVQTYSALSIPVSFDKTKQLRYIKFDTMLFEGELTTFSVIQIGRLIGSYAIKALCLTFDKVTLLPYFDQIKDDHLLYVPVLAIDSITRYE